MEYPRCPEGLSERDERRLARGYTARHRGFPWFSPDVLNREPVHVHRDLWDHENEGVDEAALRELGWSRYGIEIWRWPYRCELRELYQHNASEWTWVKGKPPMPLALLRPYERVGPRELFDVDDDQPLRRAFFPEGAHGPDDPPRTEATGDGPTIDCTRPAGPLPRDDERHLARGRLEPRWMRLRDVVPPDILGDMADDPTVRLSFWTWRNRHVDDAELREHGWSEDAIENVWLHPYRHDAGEYLRLNRPELYAEWDACGRVAAAAGALPAPVEPPTRPVSRDDLRLRRLRRAAVKILKDAGLSLDSSTREDIPAYVTRSKLADALGSSIHNVDYLLRNTPVKNLSGFTGYLIEYWEL